MYNLKDQQRKEKERKVIDTIKDKHTKQENEELFNDDDEDRPNGKKGDPFNEMRETKTGFGAKGIKGYEAEGGLQPDDEDEDEEEVGEDEDDDDEEEGDELEVEEDDDDTAF